MRSNLSNSSNKSKENDNTARTLSMFDSRYINETDYLKINENINMNNKINY